jgi:hypothetical protein
MAGSFSVTISSTSALNIGGSSRSEAAELSWIIQVGLTQIVSAHATSVTLKDRNGNVAGTMTWTKANTS